MQLSMRRLLDFLSTHGLPLQLAMPLYRQYGDLALSALRANPYLLTEEPPKQYKDGNHALEKARK